MPSIAAAAFLRRAWFGLASYGASGSLSNWAIRFKMPLRVPVAPPPPSLRPLMLSGIRERTLEKFQNFSHLGRKVLDVLGSGQMSGDNLTIVLFLLGAGITFAMAGVSQAGWKHWLLISSLFALSGIFVAAGLGWPLIKGISPRATLFVTEIATSPVAWFVVIILALTASFFVKNGIEQKNKPLAVTRDTASTMEIERDKMRMFFNSWLAPAGGGANQLLTWMIGAPRYYEDDAVRNHEPLMQKGIIEPERAAFLALSRALFETDPSPDARELQILMAKYYKTYQDARTWIVKGAKVTGCQLQGYGPFEEWRRNDARFIEELRRLSNSSRYGHLRAGIDQVGWGELTTRDLKTAGP